MVDRYQRPYLDSNVFIAWIKGEVIDGVDRGATATDILRRAERGEYRLYTSSLAIAEVHKLRSGPVLPDEPEEALLRYFEHDFIEIIDVDRGIAEEANRLCRRYGIYPNDAIHLACALRAGRDVLLAWDNRFAKVQHPDIPIEEPRLLGQGRMLGP